MNNMQIDIIGQGNVGYHLVKAFERKADVVSVNSRSLNQIRTDSDLYIVSVSDDAIFEVISKMSSLVAKESIVAHTSGSTSISVLDRYKHFGVFYPLQTFSKKSHPDYKEIPIFLEANDELSHEIIQQAAELFNNKSRWIDSDTRKKLHISSILACNFVNHLWVLADDFMNKNGLEFNDLTPLIQESVKKLNQLSPYDAQTGPAVRNDQKIIDNHLKELSEFQNLQHLYKELSESIKFHHNKKL